MNGGITSNPLDTTSNYLTPQILFGIGENCNVHGISVISNFKTSYYNETFTKDIFNNLIIWFFTLWIENTITKARIANRGFVVREYKNQEQDNNTVVLNESSYEVKDSVEWLNNKLKEIDALKEKGAITDEEYQSLREDALKKYME